MYLPYRAGADECYNGIELYIASLNMLHSRIFRQENNNSSNTRALTLHGQLTYVVSCSVLV